VSRKALGLSLAAIAIGAVVFSQEEGSYRKVYPQEFPAGAGHDLAQRSCLICHSATLVTQQAKDSTAWEKTLGTMEKWGVKLAPAEHETLRVYLLAHFGPRAAK
jgi:mono/diheme cytochrome c family protein